MIIKDLSEVKVVTEISPGDIILWGGGFFMNTDIVSEDGGKSEFVDLKTGFLSSKNIDWLLEQINDSQSEVKLVKASELLILSYR